MSLVPAPDWLPAPVPRSRVSSDNPGDTRENITRSGRNRRNEGAHATRRLRQQLDRPPLRPIQRSRRVWLPDPAGLAEMAPAGRGRALLGRTALELGGMNPAGVDELLALGAEAGAERCPARAAADGRRHRAIVRAAPVDSPLAPEFCRRRENRRGPARVHVLPAQTTRARGAPSNARSLFTEQGTSTA